MKLAIEPNLSSNQNNLVNCREELDITANFDITEIDLDVAELKILKIYKPFGGSVNKESTKENNDYEELAFNDDYYLKDKLRIQLGRVKKGETIKLIIEYSAGYYNSEFSTPRSGFHFILDKQQAWTQGETIESRYWFPCVDDPQIKFPREIHVIVPKEFTVISNGTEEVKYIPSDLKTNEERKLWIWKHLEKDQTYVTAVAIGNFVNKQTVYASQITKRSIDLSYLWPKNVNQSEYDPMLTFSHTPSIMEFIEDYTQIGYPYENYKQVAVDDFDFGGMENTTCTIITKEVFHDDKSNDHTDDRDLICHELAHQWFGDSITCKAWSDIWLNEGFASYFESLYLLHKPYNDKTNYNNDSTNSSTTRQSEFYNSIIKRTLNSYFSEFSNRYQRKIVTNIYKHPDDMFDAHSYRKGAFFLHMFRNKIGEEYFRKCLNAYLLEYHGQAVETDDFRKKCEHIVGEDLRDFFDQWLYRDGHPLLDITISVDEFQDKIFGLKLTIEQSQNENIVQDKSFEPFVFPLQVRIYYTDSDDKENEITKTIDINKSKGDYSIDLKAHHVKQLRFISFDPETCNIKTDKINKVGQ